MEMIELLMAIRNELRSAEHFAREAKKHRAEMPELSQVYYALAQEKVGHGMTLGKQAEKMAKHMGLEPVWQVENAMIEMDVDRVKKCLEAVK